jgi:hypothetical protein
MLPRLVASALAVMIAAGAAAAESELAVKGGLACRSLDDLRVTDTLDLSGDAGRTARLPPSCLWPRRGLAVRPVEKDGAHRRIAIDLGNGRTMTMWMREGDLSPQR